MAEVQDIRSVLQESMQGLQGAQGAVDGYQRETRETIDEIAQIEDEVDKLITRTSGLKERLENLGGAHGATAEAVKTIAGRVGSIATGAPILGRTSNNLERLGGDMITVSGSYGAQSEAMGGMSQALLELKKGFATSKGALNFMIEPQKGALPVERDAMVRSETGLRNYDETIGQDVPQE